MKTRPTVSQYYRKAFTLLEVMLTMSILSMTSAVAYLSVMTITRAWQNGTNMVDKLHHGDFVMEQLVMGLRSAYCPEGGVKTRLYGFWLEDDNDTDSISWVKQGATLIGTGSEFAKGPHRIKFSIEEDEEGEAHATVRSWRLMREVEGFDPEQIDPLFLPGKVVGFNCRVAMTTNEFGDIKWEDEWERTNSIPLAIEVTLRLRPYEEDGEPVEVTRAVAIPTAPLSY